MPTLTLTLAILSCSLMAAAHGLDIAAYWGQNFEEQSLSETCDTGNYAYVIIGFLRTFGGGQTPTLNIIGHPEDLESQIKYCQSKNVKVLLSIGGPIVDYSIYTISDALNVASYLLDNFLLPGQSESRPFGSAVLDGIDFYIVHGGPRQYGLLAGILALFRDFRVKFYLTASPQCLFPDPNLGKAIDTGAFDAIWVQFYNNHQCSYTQQNPDNLINSWREWSMNAKARKVFLGFPAHLYAAGSGYIPPEEVKSLVFPVVENSAKFGGIMLWDSYWDMQSNFSSKILGKDVDDKGAFL